MTKAPDMLAKLTLVLGGAASGKSAFAEQVIFATGAPRVYIATAQVYDDEMRIKVADHLKMRGSDWETHETPLDPTAALASVTSDQVVLFDCATMWLSNHMLAQHDLAQKTDQMIAAFSACKGRVVVVSNEVGMGIVPDNKLARQFRDAQGKLNQRLAAVADTAIFVIAGLPQVLKGTLP